jgi:hypothetical protein
VPLTVNAERQPSARSRGSLASPHHNPGAASPSRGSKPAAGPMVATAPIRARPRSASKRLAQVLVATCLVVGAPVALVWTLRAGDAFPSAALGVLIGTGMSLATSRLACWLWEKRPASEDLLFSDLMLWGYVRRRSSERRLESASKMLGPMGRESDSRKAPSAKRRVRLLEQLVASVEHRDPYLHGHSRRVARHAWMIAKRMGLSPTEVARIRTAAALHDVGKVHTPTTVLHKPAALNDDEFAVIMRHPDEGAEMTAVLDDPLLTSIVRHHHERLDGSGYPGGLAANTIPLGARILAVADTFDAITSARPYRAARSHKTALDVLRAESGTKLDPEVVDTFCAHYTGRRTITLWSFFATLPERLVSILLGGASTAASAAQAVALAAVVGATAVVSAGAALPDKPRAYHHTRLQILSPTGIGSDGHAVGRRPVPLTHASSPLHRSTHAATVAVAARRTASSHPASAAQAGVPGATVRPNLGGSQAGHTSGQGGAEATRTTHADAGESTQPGVPKVQPRRGPHTSNKSGGAPEKASGEPSHGKSAEAPGHNKIEEGSGKSAEAPGHTKAEESPSKSEVPHQSETEESPGKSGEAPGHNKAEESPRQSGEDHGKG